MTDPFPIWFFWLNYILAAIMWTLVGRFGMSLFLHQNSDFFFNRIFIKLTDPLLRLFSPVTPGFLAPMLHPLYVAWFFYMTRFYIVPLIFGYGAMGTLSVPLESDIATAIYELGQVLLTKKE